MCLEDQLYPLFSDFHFLFKGFLPSIIFAMAFFRTIHVWVFFCHAMSSFVPDFNFCSMLHLILLQCVMLYYVYALNFLEVFYKQHNLMCTWFLPLHKILAPSFDRAVLYFLCLMPLPSPKIMQLCKAEAKEETAPRIWFPISSEQFSWNCNLISNSRQSHKPLAQSLTLLESPNWHSLVCFHRVTTQALARSFSLQPSRH